MVASNQLRNTHPYRKNKRPSRSRFWWFLLLGLLASLLIAFFLISYLWLKPPKWLPNAPAKEAVSVTKAANTGQKTKAMEVLPSVLPAPVWNEKPSDEEYQFYELLKSGKATTPLMNQQANTAAAAAVKPKEWFLQLASQRSAAAADALRARLALMDFDVKVYYEKPEGGAWLYQVRVGPFAQKQKAEDEKDRLQSVGFEALIF